MKALCWHGTNDIRCDSVVQIADRAALVYEVGDESAISKQPWIELLLVFIISADAGNERSRSDHLALYEVALGRGAGDDEVAVLNRLMQILDDGCCDAAFAFERAREYCGSLRVLIVSQNT